ncbi:hypothetical protein Tsubulata_005833 [Turnera subulata]|uniref:FAD linked oxidase N-terminal domain-containing protein n=1 Tax=Turnera subulata TaxID=218843 RepID=A0A9Q0JQF4_9ROSI|nr:hypothetical protein Tsubulata_005833 [Turnera subulata]
MSVTARVTFEFVLYTLDDYILAVDKDKNTVTVQAGIRVQQLVDGIKERGLTLQNFASIREQQIGGIVQLPSKNFSEVSSHYIMIANRSPEKNTKSSKASYP